MAKRYPDYVQNQVPLYYMREELRENAEYPARKEYETFSFSEAIRKLKEGKKSHEPDGMAKECIFGFFLRRW